MVVWLVMMMVTDDWYWRYVIIDGLSSFIDRLVCGCLVGWLVGIWCGGMVWLVVGCWWLVV
ncbi:hypothetical protein THIOSC13_370013 [uncultured Thiomicrorhabdus sp.]